ncbi:MAG: hypothetical protein F6K42_13655 [Leptolyngbya sp. SIO1D8]|nr:hypothetical protein [Leptolyngbya sp. SIO1D8]
MVTLELELHRWLTTVLRSNPTKVDIDDCLDLLGKLSQSEKQAFWTWLSQHDPNLKKWLTQQGQQRRAA